MDSAILEWGIPLATTIIGGVVGWAVKEYKYNQEAKKQSGQDADQTLKNKKTLLEEMISKTEDGSRKEKLHRQLDEVNAALLGLCNERLRRTLKDAGFPQERALIADGISKLPPQQIAQLNNDIDEIQNLPPSDATIEQLSLLAGAYYYTHNYIKAKEIWDNILKLNPNNTDALNNRGAAYGMLEKYIEAIDDFNHAIEIEPNNPNSFHSRGYAYTKIKKYDQAFVDLNHALLLKPNDTMILYNLSCLFSLQNTADDALRYLEQAISKDIKYKETAKTDKDFDNIREDPRFKKLIGKD